MYAAVILFFFLNSRSPHHGDNQIFLSASQELVWSRPFLGCKVGELLLSYTAIFRKWLFADLDFSYAEL